MLPPPQIDLEQVPQCGEERPPRLRVCLLVLLCLCDLHHDAAVDLAGTHTVENRIHVL